MKKIYSLALLALLMVQSAFAVDVTVTMNTTSKTMSLANKATGASVTVGTPTSNKYSFSADPGTYVLTAYGTNGTTVNGTIELNVTEEVTDFTVLTNTVWATNSGWTADNDYSVEVDVNSREGVKQVITVGNSVTAGRKTFLALNGNSYYAKLIPNAAHQEEGYMTNYKSGTLTAGVNVSAAIGMGKDYTVTLPADAEFSLGMKFVHFVKFQEVEPLNTVVKGSEKEITYHLANSQVYNYRTWKKGGLTQGGYFTMNTDDAKCPKISFSDADYEAFGAKTVKHNVKWNGGYETGDIFVNINERGHLSMNVGDTYDAHAMRTWQLTENSTNNYFIEPDFHYTVIGLDGKPSTGVIEIENPNTTTDPWSVIKAVGKGTAIVLVTYDAIGLNFYSSATKSAYMGGEYWSAIWPENTAAYVVTVGEGSTAIKPNMVINEKYNTGALKAAGVNVDAEHDVFYYLDDEEGAEFTFTPEGVAKVELAYPTVGEQMATYSGFGTEGVTKNSDGSYTLLLKHGRQIVKLVDASGNAVYQVLTAKQAHREIINATRPDSKIFQPGDQVKVQYSGLFHPANKLAGIYNMSAYVTYNGTPNGTSLILGSGQYTFGSAASAQAVTVTIPADHDAEAEPEIKMNEGVIQVNGYGDPIGNHRYISRIAGRSPNFTAIAHKTYFGMIPDITIPVTSTRSLTFTLDLTPADANVQVTDAAGNVVVKGSDGKYHVTYGTFNVEGNHAGYRALHDTFTLGDDAEDNTVVPITFTAAENGTWDGTTKTQPTLIEGVYQIKNAAELAWVASTVNAGTAAVNAELVADIDLGDFDWTPIGTNTKSYGGTFNGNNHVVSGLYIKSTVTTTAGNYKGLFGYVKNATVKDFTVEGTVNCAAQYAAGAVAYTYASNLSGITNRATVIAKTYAGGITAYAYGASTIERCSNEGNVTSTANYAAGITPYLSAATTVIKNCRNSGDIDGAGYVGSLTANINNAAGTVQNSLNIGRVLAEVGTSGNVYAGTADPATRTNVSDIYVLCNYSAGAVLETIVTPEQLASGEIAYKLGDAWGQVIGKEDAPVIGGFKVYAIGDEYFNTSMSDSVRVLTDKLEAQWAAAKDSIANNYPAAAALPAFADRIANLDADIPQYIEELRAAADDYLEDNFFTITDSLTTDSLAINTLLRDLIIETGWLETDTALNELLQQYDELLDNKDAIILIKSDEELSSEFFGEIVPDIEALEQLIAQGRETGTPTSDEVKQLIAELSDALNTIEEKAMALYPEGPYGPVIVQLMDAEQAYQELNQKYADVRDELKLTNLWNRVTDGLRAEQNKLAWDLENNPDPSDLKLAMHSARIALIRLSYVTFEQAVHQHLTKEEKLQTVLDALLDLLSSRKHLVAEYGEILNDDAEWLSISQRLDNEETAIAALQDADPTAEQLDAHEAELAAIQTAMEAFAQKMETGTTAISSMHSESSILNSALIYNLRGQKVSSNYKGIVVKKGSKVLVK